VRDEFDLSACDKLKAPSSISFSALSENEMKQLGCVPVRSSTVREVFNLSASHNCTAASPPIPLSALRENEMKQQVCYSVVLV
jgi:hypothetical protein